MKQLFRVATISAFGLVFTAGMALGQNNQATITQSFVDNGQASVTQAGQSNEATVSQGQFRAADGSQVTVSQTGASNLANVEQTRRSKAVITQTGDDNKVLGLSQTGSPTVAPFANIALVDQIGDGNVLGGATPSGSIVDNAKQQGDFDGQNFLDLEQLGDNHRTNLYQSGLITAEIEQRNDGNNIGKNQGNTATVIQQVSFAPNQHADLDLLQVGLRNESTIVQKGLRSNSASIYITGNNNDVDAEQKTGGNELYLNMKNAAGAGGFDNGNIVDVDQTGGGGLVDAGISGNSNTVTVTQSGFGNTVDGSISGVGDADGLFVDGNNNTLTVTQSSDNNTATVSTVGNNNTATVTQEK